MVCLRLEGISKTFTATAAAGPASKVAELARLGRGFGKAFGTQPAPSYEPANVTNALQDIDLIVPAGETLSVVGPSGCGKTTLLRVVAGLEQPDRGRILYDDTDVTQLSPGRRGVGMVFQSYALYPNMTGRGNLAFYFRMHHREEEVDDRVRATSEMLGVGFAELLDKRPPKLSAGQQQRVAIGRCIVRDPTVFLFDEPLSNVDAKVRGHTRVVIKRLLYRFGITSLYVTHDQTEAITLGDRLAVMREGRIEQVGTYADLYERPSNRFVAGFLGLHLMSFFDGVKDGSRLLLGRDTAVPLPDHLTALARDGEPLCLGVRARDIFLREPTGGEGLLGVVQVVETVPSEQYQLAHLTVAGISCEVEADRHFRLKPGYVVRVELAPDRLYLFDGASGRALWPQ